MSRYVHFHENHLELQFTGMTALAALKMHLEVPYAGIKSVSTGEFHLPILTFRFGTTGLSDNVRHGKFLVGDEWYFLSYQDHTRVVILDLENHEFKKVVFEVENPVELRERILDKTQDSRHF